MAGAVIETLRKLEKGINMTHWDVCRTLLDDMAAQVSNIAAGAEHRRHRWGRMGRGRLRLKRAGWTNDWRRDYATQVCIVMEQRIQSCLYWMSTNEHN